jgi:hypothetical protein
MFHVEHFEYIAIRYSRGIAVNNQLLAFLPGKDAESRLAYPKFLQSCDISLTTGAQMSPNIVLAGQAMIPAQDIGSLPALSEKEK